MKKTRCLIADDHAIVRDGIRQLLTSDRHYAIVAEASDGEQAVERTRKLKPDVVIMDISMPGLNGIEATSIIKKEFPRIQVIILTVHEAEEYIFQILRAGANGYVLKNSGKKEIFAALKAAVSGEKFFSPDVSKVMIDSLVQRTQGESRIHENASLPRKDNLTNRETEILQHIANGHSNRKIAELLYLSIRTVNTHRCNLMQKLDMHDTAALVRYAIKTGIIDLKVQRPAISVN